MMDSYERDFAIFKAIIMFTVIVLIFAGAYMVAEWVQKAFADDDEDRGKPTLNEQLLQRAREWNINKAVNETMQIAERFTCFNSQDLADQYFNMTGIKGTVPCPDYAISGIPEDESGK